MKRQISIFLFLLLNSFPAVSQSEEARTALYLEILGNGGLYSINVERKLTSKFFGRVGVGSWSTEGGYGDETFVTFPVMGNFLFGEGANRLELGAGLMVGWSSSKSVFGEGNDRNQGIFSLTAVVGYRYQKPGGGFMGRIGLTPFVDLSGNEDPYLDSGFYLSGGVSVGYSF